MFCFEVVIYSVCFEYSASQSINDSIIFIIPPQIIYVYIFMIYIELKGAR